MLRFLGFMTIATLMVVAVSPSRTLACPFCAAVSQTLRQEMESMDAVAIGELLPDPRALAGEIDGQAKFRILKILRGDKVIAKDQVITASYFGPAKTDKHFLLMGVDQPNLLWSSPLPITGTAEEYLSRLPNLPKDSTERLLFFQKYLEHEDPMLARDAYDEFAMAPYSEVKELKSHMDRTQLIKWIKNNELSPDRKRLYFTMLGICGQKDDTELLEKMMRSKSNEDKAGLDALIACYITLRGEAGLPLIEELFLNNPKCPYAEIYSAIMALRFHGTDGGILEKKQIVKSMHHILKRPDLADLVIPDLARWEDWSQIDTLVALFKNSDSDSSWVRVPVINYLRACPLPEAQQKLAELEKIDPAAVKRATTFFPLPAPTPAKADSSSWRSPTQAPASTDRPWLDSEDRSADLALDVVPPGSRVFGSSERGPFAMTAPLDPPSMVLPPMATPVSNPFPLVGVVGLAAVTLGLSMWTVLDGGHRAVRS